MKMKKLLTALAGCAMLGALFMSTAFAEWTADTSWYNETDKEFTITTADQLAGIASLVSSYKYLDGVTITLGNDIDLENQAWTPIGSNIAVLFKGTFDGNGKTISGLYINTTDSNQGLFGYSSGTICNLNVIGNVSGGKYVGGVVGSNKGTVKNCSFSGTVFASDSYVGGIVGNNEGGTVESCANSGAVSGASYIGGIAGYNEGGTVESCANSGAVSGTNNGGGIVGKSISSSSAAIIESCVNSGSVTVSNSGAGGIVGWIVGTKNEYAIIKGCSNNATVSGSLRVGSIIGMKGSYYTMTECTSAEEVISEDRDIVTELENNGFEAENGTYARGDEITLTAPGTVSAITVNYILTTDGGDTPFGVDFSLDSPIDGNGDVKLGVLLYNIPNGSTVSAAEVTTVQ